MLMQVLNQDAGARPVLMRFTKRVELFSAVLLVVYGVWLATLPYTSGAFIGHTADGLVKIVGGLLCLRLVKKRWHTDVYTVVELMLVSVASQLAREWFAHVSTDGIHQGGWPGVTLGMAVVLLGGVMANSLRRRN